MRKGIVKSITKIYYFFLIFYYFKRSIIKATAKNTLKNRSYGKKVDKLRKKVRFKNLNYSEKATKTLNCVHKMKNI